MNSILFDNLLSQNLLAWSAEVAILAIAAGVLVLAVPPFLFPYLPFHDLIAFIGMHSYPPKLSHGPTHYYTFQLTYFLHHLISRVCTDLGIGAQGLGGLTTVLDVKIRTWPTHAASKPVAMIPNCAATRHAHFVLDGSGPSYLEPPSLDLWPNVHWAPDYNTSRRVNLDELTAEEVASWKPG